MIVIKEPTIMSIYGVEPMRKGEYASCYQVGSKFNGHIVVGILKRRDGWFSVFAADNVLLAEMNSNFVSEVIYEVDDPK